MEKKKIEKLPDLPGIYIFKDEREDVLYIGKANSILKRVKDHFTLASRSPKERSLLEKTRKVDYIVTASEPEALLLESVLIKENRPRYNINFKDDKSYPCVKITLGEEYPSIYITRKKTQDGSLYLGPYPNVKKLRTTLKTLREIFPYRHCRRLPKSACLYFHLQLCQAPCVEKVDREEYRKNILAIIRSLLGELEQVVKELTQEMDFYVKRQEFERAALVRDRIKAMGKISSLFGFDESINTLQAIKQKLNLPHLPRIIDGVDISNISGKLASGSVIRFRDGAPDKDFYRRFRLKRDNFIDDYQMMKEVVLRRYRDALEAGEKWPDLIILDGGKGHLNKIDSALQKELNLDLPLIAYAKGRDVIFSKYRKEEVRFAPGSSEKNLLQRIRNEAHRFAIGYHRLLRKKKMQHSIFEEIPGVGKRKAGWILTQLETLGSLESLAPSDLKKVKGIGDILANRIYAYLKQKGNREASGRSA